MCVLVGQVTIAMTFEDVWTASAGGEGTFVDGARLINIALRLQRRLRLRCAHYDAAKSKERERRLLFARSLNWNLGGGSEARPN